jgi:hypothetical protein
MCNRDCTQYQKYLILDTCMVVRAGTQEVPDSRCPLALPVSDEQCWHHNSSRHTPCGVEVYECWFGNQQTWVPLPTHTPVIPGASSLTYLSFLFLIFFFFNISVVPGVKPRPHKCYTSILPLSYRPSPVIPHFLNDIHTTHFSGWWGLSKHQNITSILYQGTILIPLMFQKALWLTANEMVALNDQEGWREG